MIDIVYIETEGGEKYIFRKDTFVVCNCIKRYLFDTLTVKQYEFMRDTCTINDIDRIVLNKLNK